MQRETSRSRSAEFYQREKRQSVMFTPESNAFATIPGTSRSSHSSVVSAGSQRLQGMRHPSMLEASRHRLSIRKSAAFPMQQTAPKPFLSSCADITRHGRDWNSEFQLAWEMEDNTISQAESRMEQLRRIEKEFVAEATRTVKQIVMLDDDGPRELPKFLQCYRVDNIFFRVLPDSRSGRNYVASLRGVLQSRTRLLTVPLSCMFFFRGMPVLAQALVPMPRDPTRLYGAGSTNNQEVEAEILNMAEALNIPFPDGTLEVYEGLDGRFYLTNSNSTLTPLFVDDTIMKRQEMLRVCSHVTDGHEDTLAVLDKYEVLDAVVKSCMDSETLPIVDCLKNVCEYLHGFGVNMCLLKQVIHKIVQSRSYDSVVVNKVKELLFVEMLARSVKQEFYLEVQGKRVAYDDEVLSATLSKHMAETFTSVDVFQSRFLEVVAKKYGVVDEDNDIIQGLTSVRLSRKSDIVTRICTLLGVSIEKSSSNKTNMKWHVSVNARVLPQLIDPQQVRILAETYRTIMTQEGHRYAYCLPIRWKVACWDGEYDEALDLVHATAMAQKERYGADEIVPLYSRRSVCEVCFATMQKNCIEEGRSLFPGVMKGFEELTCPMTQGKRHIEYGFWLLRVALVYQQDDLVTYRSCVEEAVHHFYRAIEKLPSYLKSEHGSWLHLQPYKGLLQCKRLLPSCSVNTNELVERSIELSTIGWASDFFMLYLWDLSLQLETEGRYTDAIRVLLTAITVSKKKPTVSMDLPTLLMDAAHIYRSWDQDKYSEHCATLMREAADKASELFGPTSREYAVVLNNKGAVEIELNRLKDAQETLTKAGMVFKEAKVPEDDPDYKAYLENLLYLEQRLAARPMVRRGFLRRYPFLAARSEDFVFSDLCPLEDDVFVTLAHERARMAGGTPDAKKLERQMKERLWELLRFIQDGDILKRYPFLPAMIHNVPTASLRLDDDALFEEFARQLQDSNDVAERKELEFRTREYVVKKAGDTALQRAYMDRREEAFNEAHEGYVNLMHPIPWVYVLEDERFNTLCDQLQKHINTQGQTLRTEGIQEKMAQRVAEIENETFHRRRELVTWLSPSKVYSVPIKDLMGDMDLLDLLRIRQAPSSCDNVTVDTIDILIRNKLEAVWKRAYITRSCLDVDDEELYREFPFLVEMPHHQRLSTLMLYEDPAVSSLAARLQKRDADSRLQTEMTGAVKAIAARRRDAKELKKWYYDIDSVVSGTISLESVPKVRDEYYVRLWQKRNIVQAQEEDNSPLMVTIMHQMEHRIKQMNSWMRKATANGFRRRLRLEAKYPFVTRRHRGYTLEMLDIEDDEEFMSIVQERQKLIAGSNASLGDIERLGDQANKRVAKIASNRVKLSEHLSQQYPFIPSRLEGVETLTICLEENGTFAETAAYYRQLCESGSSENEVRRRRLVREMENIALAIAREIGVRKWRESIESEDLHERYPFLPEEPARGILLGDVRPVQQPAFRELSNTLDELRRDSSRNAKAIRATQEQMTALVVRLAEERVEATEKAHKEFPFLPRRVLGVRLGDIPLAEDELFAAATREGANGKESLLQSRALELVVHHSLSEAQFADNDDAVLSQHPYLIYTSRKCFPLRLLPLEKDVMFIERLREYGELMQVPSMDDDASAVARFRLVCRADELALKEIDKIERIKRSYEELGPLSLDDLCRLQDHREFQSYTEDGKGKLSPLFLEDAKRSIIGEREDRVARLKELDTLRKRYPMLGRDIDSSILDDPVVAKLMDDRNELLDDTEGNEEKLEEIEKKIARYASEYKAHQDGLELPPSPLKREVVNSYIDDMEDDVLDDAYYQELMTEYTTVEKRKREKDVPLLRRLATQIQTRKDQIRQDNKHLTAHKKKAEERIIQQYPSLAPSINGVSILELHPDEDDSIRQLEEQRTSNKSVDVESLTIINNKIRARAEAMAKAILDNEDALAAALPFLGRSVKGVPLRELALMTDSDFADLAARYGKEASSSNTAERSRLEQELRDQAHRIARDTRIARRLNAVRGEDLHERYPFLPEEPARGILLGDVRPVQQPAFRELSNTLDELRRDSSRNAKAIRATQEQMTALVVRLAEERVEATEKAHKEFPFLPRRVLGVRLGDVMLNEDDVLSQLARRRMRQLKYSSSAKDVSQAEKEMVKRAEELARTATLVDVYRQNECEYVRARNPFLVYEDRKCVLLSEIPLISDSEYQSLFRDHLTALEDVEANTQRISELEDALRARADELALSECEKDSQLTRYSFLTPYSFPGWADALLRDAEFQQLRDRYDELSRDPVKNADALRELEDAMNARGRAVAEALHTAERNSAQEQTRLGSVGPTERSVSEDGMANSAIRVEGRSAKSDAMRSHLSVSFIKDENQLDEGCGLSYTVLPQIIKGVAQTDLYLDDDAYFQELLARYNELVLPGAEPTVPLAKRLREQLRMRAEQLAVDVCKLSAAEERAAARTTALLPFLDSAPLGVALSTIPLEDDDEFCALLREYEGVLTGKSASVGETEEALRKRAEAMAKAILDNEDALAAALPFLGRSVKGIPLRELALMTDSDFADLAARYGKEASSSNTAERSRLEQELRDQAHRIARDTRIARRLNAVRGEDLHERYPFLPEEPARGILLGDVRPVQQPAFRELSNTLDELRRDSSRNAKAIRATQEQMTALVVRLAEERVEATEKAHKEFPFLPRRVLGVRLGDVMLNEDDVLSQLARRRMRQLKYSSSAKDVSQAEKEMVKRAEELARTATLVDVYRQNECEYVRARNPFLVYEDRKCVLLSEIPLISDSEYQSLFRDHLTALEDVEANTQRISELEDALRARADELALSECEKDSQLTRYSFLTPYSVPGWADALLRDAEFQQLRDRYDELSRDPVKNADALRELEDAMNARGRAVAEALHTAERNSAQEQARVRVKFPMCVEPPVSVESDSELLKLLKRRSSLKGDILEYSKNIASIDKNVLRRASLLNLSVEESAIEFCQESEVVTFEVRMKRNAGRHRRARIPGGANRKRASGVRSSFSTEVGEFEAVKIGVLEEGANGVTNELSASAQVSRDNKLVDSEEARERNTISQEEEQHRVELGLNDVPQPESASSEEKLREQEEATNTNLLPLLTNQEEANRNAFDTEYEISKTDTVKEITAEELSSTQAQEGTTTIAPLFDQESSARAELLRTEEEERETLGAEYLKHEDGSSGQFVELGEDQTAEELLYPLSASEANQLRGEAEKEMRKQKDTLYNEELEERDTMYESEMEQGGRVHDLALTEGVSSDPSTSLKELLNKEEHERNTIMTIEEGDRIALEFMRLTDAEILLRKETEKEAEDTVKEAISLKESGELLDKLIENLLSTEKTEEEERSKLLDDEAHARDQLVLEADEGEAGASQRVLDNLNEALLSTEKTEEEERSKLLDDEAHARDQLVLEAGEGEAAARQQVLDNLNEALLSTEKTEEEERSKLLDDEAHARDQLVLEAGEGEAAARQQVLDNLNEALLSTEKTEEEERSKLLDDEAHARDQLVLEAGEGEAAARQQVLDNLNEALLSTEKTEEEERSKLLDDEAHARDQLVLEAGEGEAAARQQVLDNLNEALLSTEKTEEEERSKLLDDEAHARDQLVLEAGEGEAAARQQVLDNLNEALLSTEKTEEEERSKLLDDEAHARDQLVLEAGEGEAAARQQVLDNLNEALLSTEKTEEEERSKLLDDEAHARDQLVLEADEEEIALRQQRKMADDLRFLMDEEVMSREVTICEEDEDWKRMEWQFHTFFGLLVSLAKLANSEEELRSSIRSTEESEFNALKEKGDDDSVEALRAQEEREAVEEEIRQAKRKHDAGMLIKSVVFAYRTRRRLANRFFNRKAQECENAFGDTFCMEFNARSAISDEEKAERQQIDEAKRSLLSRTRKPSIKTFAELEKEEDDVRNHLIDDCMFHLSQLQRASRKAVARQNEFIPSLKNLQEFEENEDRAKGGGMPSTAKARFNLPLSDPGDAEEEEGDDDEECEEEEEDDYNAPLNSGKYKGYALDPIGSFLLQYERDLRRFKASLEKNRMSVAAEHDLLKKTRDNATQDMVHGGTGALWVPTRPLPLSDLVRGPSAQYRRGRIVDARGQRPSSRMTDADGRVVTPSGAPTFGGFIKEGNSF